MITVAITGGYATGKTVVANMFAGLGAEVLVADRIAHMTMQPYSSVWKGIVEFFSKRILKRDDQIDRPKLARIVFRDKKKLNRLNKIVHPAVKEELKRIIQDRRRKGRIKILAVEIPLLYEVGMADWFDKVIVVTCNNDIQYKRGRARTSKKELLLRISSQWPVTKKEKLADFIVDNSGTMEETKRKVVAIWNKLKEG